ncbi:MAG: hypothetical protein PWQ57_269 [Desulfovibrionales bacterium]|nr:hypothetical protein [Desulfovibrionales bacterium]
MTGEPARHSLHPGLAPLFRRLQEVNQTAYRLPYVLCNRVLSKIPDAGALLAAYTAEYPPAEPGRLQKAWTLVRYLVRNVVWFALHAAWTLAWMCSGQKYDTRRRSGIRLIDAYFLIGKILDSRCFQDVYFPGLTEEMQRLDEDYIHCPRFYGAYNPIRFFRMFRILAKEGRPVLSEFQLLRFSDRLRMLLCIALYPLQLLKVLRLLGDSREDKALRSALWRAMDDVVLGAYARGLFAKRLSHIFRDGACISWYENQELEKCFIQGLRSGNQGIRIIGAQLYIWPDSILNFFPDPAERMLGLTPDKILANGPYYLQHTHGIDCAVGPSLRYRRLFEQQRPEQKGDSVLLLTSYFENETRLLLEWAGGLDLGERLSVRFHPAVSVEAHRALLPRGASLSQGDLYDAVQSSMLVAGRSTGALVEALALGVPCVTPVFDGRFVHQYLPETGRGVLWFEVRTRQEFSSLLDELRRPSSEQRRARDETAKWFREHLFCEPTAERICEAFELGARRSFSAGG